MVPALAAGTRAGTACANARSSTSTIRCEVSTFPPATAAGGTCVHDRARGCLQRQWPQNAFGRGRIFLEQAAQHVEARGERDGANCIDAAGNLRRGAGEVDMHAARLRIESEPHRDLARLIRYAIAVEPVLGAELAVRHCSQLRTHQAFGVIEQVIDERLQFLLAELLRELRIAARRRGMRQSAHRDRLRAHAACAR